MMEEAHSENTFERHQVCVHHCFVTVMQLSGSGKAFPIAQERREVFFVPPSLAP